jgi:hypothetical protein
MESYQAFGVVEVADVVQAVGAFVEQPGDQRQGGVGLTHQGQARDAQRVVDAGPPVPSEDLGEDPDDVVDSQVRVAAVRAGGGQRVEAARVGLVGVDDDQPFGGLGGEPVQDVDDQVASGVDDDDAAVGVHVGQDHVQQQRGFAGAGLADQVHVLAGVDGVQTHGVPAQLGAADDLHSASAGRDGCGGGHRLGAGPVQAGHGQILREGGEGGEFLDRGEEPAS